MRGIPLLWQITILITVLAGVAVVLAALARASRRDYQDGAGRRIIKLVQEWRS